MWRDLLSKAYKDGRRSTFPDKTDEDSIRNWILDLVDKFKSKPTRMSDVSPAGVNQAEHRKIIEKALFKELEYRTFRGIPEFHRYMLPLDSHQQELSERLVQGGYSSTVGQWTGFTDTEETKVRTWLQELLERHLPAERHALCSTASLSDIEGLDKVHFDLVFQKKSATVQQRAGAYDLGEVLVIGDSGSFNLHHHPKTFANVMVAYATMNDEKMGLDPFVKGGFAKWTETHVDGREEQWSFELGALLVNQRTINSRATTVYQIDNSSVAKFSWAPTARQREVDILKAAASKGVPSADNHFFKGMLIDLDLAKVVGEPPSGAVHRTGTPRFMAIGVLRRLEHSYKHDLESFLYCLVWMAGKVAWAKPEFSQCRAPPLFSRLDGWDNDDFESLAEVKADLMSTIGSLNRLLLEFPPALEPIKPLCRSLYYETFRYRSGDGASEQDGIHKHYQGTIDAYNRAIKELRRGPETDHMYM
ncbi:hypothetical protein CDD80_3608 [Ophiocordyceps camponoti-rufipedis]|uniref:Fungal-type protein kinase domain-containing protein n=1 Tax=Ophiocordyceps camponoti-rufipedis TaxID=2004952 RepID=A0A2C5Z1T4_9HYPO|nr:hypothetical protein CDD80_3608 [Ophiocordyceps camponoti-rufipedis]